MPIAHAPRPRHTALNLRAAAWAAARAVTAAGWLGAAGLAQAQGLAGAAAADPGAASPALSAASPAQSAADTTRLNTPPSASVQGSGTADSTDSADDSDDSEPGSALPLWEVGGFAIGGRQLAYPGSRQQVGVGLALPYAIYRGRVLRADQGTVGLRAFKTARSEVDIGFAGAFGSSASGTSARRGMPDIGTLVEFGPRLKLTLGGGFRAALPLRGVFDLSDSFRHRGMAFEPEISWRTRAGAWSLGSSLSWVVGDERLASTFYSVAPEFVASGRTAYEARAGLISTRLAFTASRRFGRDWRVFNFVRLDSVAGAANRDSPLVESRSGTSFGVGLSWTWLRSEARSQP